MGLFDFFKKSNKNTKLQKIEIPCDVEFLMNSDELIEHRVGDIQLPTGKIIAADPFISDHTTPFVKTVAPGNYPAFLYFKEQGENHYRVAYSKIKFKQEKATRWILALTERDDLDTVKQLKQGQFLGFPVDAGLAFFADEETHNVYLQKSNEYYMQDEIFNYYDDILYDEMVRDSADSKYSSKDGDWANHIPDATFNGNMIICSSGWGDGHYPVYWGLNQQNEIVELAIDFFVTTDKEDATIAKQRIRKALNHLLTLPKDGFVIFESEDTKKFVQFALTSTKELLFDLPTQSLSEEEIALLKPIATQEGFTFEHAIYNKVLGKDTETATNLVCKIMEDVYLLYLDGDIKISFG